MRGRKPKPSYLKLHSEPADFDRTVPVMPSFVEHNLTAKGEWDRVIPLLETAGVLSSADSSTLGAYCLCYARWLKCEERIAEEGLTVGLRKNPLITVSIDYLKQLKTFADQFGLTPQARTRLEKPEEESDPLTEFNER